MRRKHPFDEMGDEELAKAVEVKALAINGYIHDLKDLVGKYLSDHNRAIYGEGKCPCTFCGVARELLRCTT